MTSFSSKNSGDASSSMRKAWSAPRVIESKVSRKTEKVHSTFGYEYHETGTTAAS